MNTVKLLLFSLWIPATEKIFLVISYKNQNQSEFVVTCRTLLDGYAKGVALESHEVKFGACGCGHEQKEEGVQAGVETAQTHRHVEVRIQTFSSIYRLLHKMEKMQDSSGDKAHQEDGEHQRAGLDVLRPVAM